MNRSLEIFLFGEGKYRWVRHVLFWIGMYLDEIAYIFLVDLDTADLMSSALSLFLDVVVVYICLIFFFKWFFLKKRYFSFAFATLILVIIDVAIIILYNNFLYDQSLYIEDWLSSIISTLTLVSTAIGLKIGKFYYKQLELTQELQSSQSKLELNSLKQQINPHFLFNVLNTINVQSMSDPAAVSDTVINLSDLLRYQTYEAGDSDLVPLVKEVSFLKNYLNLEKMRRSNLQINWQESSILPKIKITPFLFLPLVENAIKHSVSLEEKESNIDINWHFENNELTLKVSNTIGNVKNKEEGGFGIDNLKKRLNLLYPNNYKLEMTAKSGIFLATLQINLP